MPNADGRTDRDGPKGLARSLSLSGFVSTLESGEREREGAFPTIHLSRSLGKGRKVAASEDAERDEPVAAVFIAGSGRGGNRGALLATAVVVVRGRRVAVEKCLSCVMSKRRKEAASNPRTVRENDYISCGM